MIPYTIMGVMQKLKLLLGGKDLHLVGVCHGCGNCCRRISLAGPHGWLHRQEDFRKLVAKYPEYGRFQLIGRDSQGYLLFSCNWLAREGMCSNYEARLPLCRSYPDKTLVFTGGALLAGCGYRFEQVRPFAKVLQETIKNHDV